MIAPLLSALAVSFAPALPAATGDDLDHAALAAAFRERNAVEGIEQADLELEAVLKAHYTSAQVGAFEVHFPAQFLEDSGGLGLFQDAIGGLIDVQEAWLESFGAPDAIDASEKDFKELRKWLKGAKRYRPGDERPVNFLDAFGGDEALRYAAEHLHTVMTSAEGLGFKPVGQKRARIVLSPTRQDFVESVCFFGQLLESIKGLYWHQAVINWTEFWWQDVQVVALIYPSPAGVDPYTGFDMNKRETTGVAEHVAQRGAIGLGWFCFGDGLSPTFELGIAQMMVVDVFGQNNVRSGGSVRGNATSGYSAFIPGGNPSGGVLPAVSADSKWRDGKGKDYFTKNLRAAQKAGAKSATEAKTSSVKWKKTGWFVLEADGGRGRTEVGAPFLGTQTEGKQHPAEEYMSDYLEFFRAYKTNFLYWLREEGLGKGKSKESPEAFRELMGKVALAGGTGDFEALVEEVYGVPLSAETGEDDSLEWRYLAWLAKQ